MKITILTKEESQELNRIEREKKLLWTLEQIVEEARFLRYNIPDMGNTKYITGEENWIKFFVWLKTDEAIEQWKLYTSVLESARYYAWKYQHGIEFPNDLTINKTNI
jgi:hypothetical protein